MRSKLRGSYLLLLAIFVLGLTGSLQAATVTVQVGGTTTTGGSSPYGGSSSPLLAFTPSSVTINVGDTVTFTSLGGAPHNVDADDGSFRCANGCDNDGKGGNGNPSAALWTASVTFTKAGVVNFHCDDHVSMGMVGSITVNAVTPPPPAITIGGYISGNWYNVNQGGQGFQIEAATNNNMVAIWFVYAPDGSGNQNWIYAQGAYDPTSNTVTLPAVLLTGAQFPPNFNSNDVVSTPWGSITFTFTDCNDGTVTWAPTLTNYPPSSAPLAITRLTQIDGTTCPASK